MNEGLEGVVVAETELSSVDGEKGELIVYGRPIAAVAELGFGKLAGLLWHREKRDVSEALGAARVAAWEKLPALGDALRLGDAMSALRASTAHLHTDDPAALTGAMAVFAAAWARTHAGEDPIAPDTSKGHAEDLLRMIRGSADEAEARALDAYLCTVVDHGLNASTFAARVVTSTESDLVSAVVAAIGALKGRLHGGAPGPVLDMLDAIGTEENVEPWLLDALERKERIMGIGHRVYRVRDPRAAVLETALTKLDEATATDPRTELARTVEKKATSLLLQRKPDRPLHANVEFYTALLLERLGIPRPLFTAVFACSRVVGWSAHVREQRARGRLMRPRARYVGPHSADSASSSRNATT